MLCTHHDAEFLSEFYINYGNTLCGNVINNAATGTPFVDLLPAVAAVTPPESLWVTSTDAHPNGKAATLYAELLQKTLEADFPEIMKR